jgi:hypothetical protein
VLRRTASIALLVLAVVLAPLTVVAAWARAEINDTDRYVRTVAPLARDPDVQRYVAGAMATSLYDAVGGERLEALVPEDLAPLQPVIDGALRAFLNEAAARFTESPAFENLWDAANRAAHEVVQGVLTGDSEVLELSGGQLTLDLRQTMSDFQTYLVDQGFDLAGQVDLTSVPQTIVLAEGSQLQEIETVRELVGMLNTFSWVLFLATLAAAVGSVLVAPDRRRAVSRLGIGFALAMLLVAVGLGVARSAFLGAVGSAVPTEVAGSFYDAVVGSMRAGFRSIFAVGLILAGLVLLTAQPSWARRWARPTQVAVAVLGVLVILGWTDPQPGFILFVLVLTAAAVLILEVVRRRTLAADGAPPPPAAEDQERLMDVT